MPRRLTMNANAEPRELAHRSEAGVSITLTWNARTDALLVSLCDARRGAYFEIHPEPECALEVYRNPYAYVST